MLADELGVHISGLADGAALMRKRGCGNTRLWRRLRGLVSAVAFVRHVNRPQCASFLGEVANELKVLNQSNTNLVTQPAATNAATASFSELVNPQFSTTTPATMYVAPAPDVTHAAPTDLVSPAPAHVAPSFSTLVNPQSSTAFVETFASKVTGSCLFAPVNQAYQEQNVAERTTQNIVGSFFCAGTGESTGDSRGASY